MWEPFTIRKYHYTLQFNFVPKQESVRWRWGTFTLDLLTETLQYFQKAPIQLAA